MRPSTQNGLLPYGLVCLCLEAILLFSGATVEARRQQQCRLEPRNQVVLHPPTNSGVGAAGNLSAPSATASSYSTGSPPLPSQTPFIYGKDTIRGVNLYVLCPLCLILQRGSNGCCRGGWFVLEVNEVCLHISTHFLTSPNPALDHTKHLPKHGQRQHHRRVYVGANARFTNCSINTDQPLEYCIYDFVPQFYVTRN